MWLLIIQLELKIYPQINYCYTINTTLTMKNYFLKSFCIATLLLFINQNAKAQVTCPLSFMNNLACSVSLKYTVYDSGCNVLCTGTLAVLPYNSAQLGAGCCSNAFDIAIDIFDVGGSTPTSSGTSVSIYCVGNSVLAVPVPGGLCASAGWTLSIIPGSSSIQ